ncbi:hypothetical protein [Shinella sp. BYT-45]|uniref:hypothetical protein n=1 Tax=Shinella sp. BYT-45 TaxID=3377377 RepID=UPI003980BB8D
MEAEREIEKEYSVTEFVAELRRLADVLESSEGYSIRLDDEEVVVPQDAIASIAYEIEEGHAEIEFQLSWETGEAEGSDDDDGEHEDEAEGAAA